MFKEISIQNLRGIKELKIDDFAQINLFLGKNNSCKTTVLEALYCAINPSNPSLLTNTNIIRGLLNTTKIENINKTSRFSMESLFYNLNTENPLQINSVFNFLELEQEKQNIIITALKDIISSSEKSSSSISTALIEIIKGLNFSFEIIKNKRKKEKFESIQILKEKEIFENKIDEKYLKYANQRNGFYLFSHIANDLINSDLKSKFDNILYQKKEKELIDNFKKLIPEVQAIKFLDAFYIDIGLPKLIRLESLGEGAKKFFVYICRLLGDESLKENSIILIDEIENGIYYDSQKILWKFLFNFAKEKKIQIFATTHSIDCIKAFVEIAEEESKKKEDLIRIFRLIKGEDNVFDISKYNLTSAKIILNEYNLEIR